MVVIVSVGIRRSESSIESLSVLSTDVGITFRNGDFLKGDVSGLEAFLEKYRAGSEWGDAISGYAPYAYIVVDCVERRVLSWSRDEAPTSIRLSTKLGVEFYFDAKGGREKDVVANRSLMAFIHDRAEGDGFHSVGPYADVEDLLRDPDYAHENVYRISSPFWVIQDLPRDDLGYESLKACQNDLTQTQDLVES